MSVRSIVSPAPSTLISRKVGLSLTLAEWGRANSRNYGGACPDATAHPTSDECASRQLWWTRPAQQPLDPLWDQHMVLACFTLPYSQRMREQGTPLTL